MKRKILKIGIISVSCIAVGYLIGSFLPLQLFKPDFADETLNKGEYYRLITSIVSAFITFLALIVALFKDDLRVLWNCPKIQFLFPENITIEECESEVSNQTKIAKRYISRIEVQNNGNLPAFNAEIFLTKLEFKPKDNAITQNIETYNEALKWEEKSDLKSIIIPPGGKKMMNIVEIIAPEKISTPALTKENKPPILSIGTTKHSKEDAKGEWIATFTLYAQNHNPIDFTIEIKWSGKWESRLTEFKNQYKITQKS
jgi:hypothetical protein